MKFWLLAIGIFISTAIQAQFGFYAQGGANYSKLRVTRNPGGAMDGKGGYGWQATLGTEYHTQFGFFLFLEAGISSQAFGKDSSGTVGDNITVRSSYDYKPLYLNFPFGVGYQFPLSKEMAFRVYGGVTSQTGIGGSVNRKSTTLQKDANGQEVIIKTEDESHNINFGRSIQVQNEFRSDLANAMWGLTAGVGLNFSKSFEVTAIYQSVLTNILPGGDGVPEMNKLGALSFNLKYYFSRSYYNANNTKKPASSYY